MLGLRKYWLFLALWNLMHCAHSKDFIPYPVKVPEIICQGADSNAFVRILPPKKLLLQSEATLQGLNFIAYFGTISAEARHAAQYAMSLWSGYLKSDVPIRIFITEKPMGTGVLASAYPGSMLHGFEGSTPNVLYPVALAEKIARKELNSTSQYDIVVNISDNHSMWYYGTDGNTPANKYDLVTIVMHEITHGLGYTGSMKINELEQGEWGFFEQQMPTVYDLRVINASDNFLTNETLFRNPSLALRHNYTSNNLYFHSPISLLNNPDDGNPRLYAPSSFHKGSSICHLDDDTYGPGNINSLMTHATAKAEAIHVPGPITISMLEEMGWSHTYIDHVPLKDTENHLDELYLFADINSDNPPNIARNYLFFNFDGSDQFDSIKMWDEEFEGHYASLLPPDSNVTMKYYIKAYDGYQRSYTYPIGAPDLHCSFYIGTDTIFPEVLSHDPIPYMTIDELSKDVSIKVTDNLGIDTVLLKYTIHGSETLRVTGLALDTLDTYRGQMTFNKDELRVDDIIDYWFVISDKGRKSNTLVYGLDKLHFEIEAEPVKEYYSQDFNSYTADFEGVFKSLGPEQIAFQITMPEGFLDSCLHTPNPYRSPGENNNEFEYIAKLKFPIKLTQNAAMRFDEIVLVEPSEPGAVFGTKDFWDYVIVEASKDSGTTWHNLQPGYDSRKQGAWLSTYVSHIDINQNSLAKGNPSLYVTNHINIFENPVFQPGDVVFFRFRLFSDPFANGWGWAIDNLEIQGLVGIEPLPFDNAMVHVFPNPVIEKLNVQVDFNKIIGELNVVLIDILGKTILSDRKQDTGQYENSFDVGHLPSGMYLLVIDAGTQKRVRKLLKH
jgi:hypothetical protein